MGANCESSFYLPQVTEQLPLSHVRISLFSCSSCFLKWKLVLVTSSFFPLVPSPILFSSRGQSSSTHCMSLCLNRTPFFSLSFVHDCFTFYPPSLSPCYRSNVRRDYWQVSGDVVHVCVWGILFVYPYSQVFNDQLNSSPPFL
jgi:hypothetical protein